MERFGNIFITQTPRKILLNLGIKFSIFSICNPLMWMLALFLGKTFAEQRVSHGAVVSEVVTSIGLMQSINIIGVVFFIAIGAGSNTYIARIFGQFKLRKKKKSLKELSDDSELKYLFGSTTFCFFALCLVLIPTILIFGHYVARLQNFHLPANYGSNIQILIIFYALSLPFFGFITYVSYHLNSEGNTSYCSVIGVLNVIFFIAFLFLFEDSKLHSISQRFCHQNANNEIICNVGCAVLLTGISLFITQLIFLFSLYKRNRSVIFPNLLCFTWVR